MINKEYFGYWLTEWIFRLKWPAMGCHICRTEVSTKTKSASVCRGNYLVLSVSAIRGAIIVNQLQKCCTLWASYSRWKQIVHMVAEHQFTHSRPLKWAYHLHSKTVVSFDPPSSSKRLMQRIYPSLPSSNVDPSHKFLGLRFPDLRNRDATNRHNFVRWRLRLSRLHKTASHYVSLLSSSQSWRIFSQPPSSEICSPVSIYPAKIEVLHEATGRS